jgi:phospholipid/cholesterol/gamma-HCH transport system substrate-binding protein
VKRFRERNRAVTGAVGIAVTLVLVVGALQFEKLPLIHNNATYSADFANAGGLDVGDIVTIDGVKVGAITGMALDGDRVKVTFTVQPGLHLGSTTSASAQVLSPVGTEYMEISPSGPGTLNALILEQYNIPELEKSLEVGSTDLNATPAKETTAAFDGLARFSEVLGNEQSALATIVSQGAALSAVLSQRSHQLFNLFGQSNLVLNVLEQRRTAIRQLLTSTATLSQQITSILSVNRSQLTTLLQSLQGVSAILQKDSNDFGQAIPVLAAFSRYGANTTGSGPFADVSVPTLLIPDNLIAQCSNGKSFPSTNAEVGCRP